MLALVVLVCFGGSGLGWNALLRGPVGDRIDTVADAIMIHLRASDYQNQNDVLKEFGQKYGIKFYLFSNHGQQLAGEPTTLPISLQQRLKQWSPPRPGFPHGSPNGPPPPEFPHGGPNGPPPPEFSHGDRSHFPMFPNFPKDRKFAEQADNKFWIVVRTLAMAPDHHHPMPAVLIASSNNIWQSRLLFDFEFLGMVLGALLLLSLLFWWPFVHRITHQLSALTAATESIAVGNFDTKLKVGPKDEIGRLAEAVNLMAERLNSFVSGQKRFLGDISHELVTPIARLNMAIELFETASEAEQKDLIVDIKDEVAQMNHLVEELLAFAKAGLKGKQADLVPVHLKPLVEETRARLSSKQEIQINVAPEICVLADPLLLARSISNVLRNSLRYAADAGPITVTAKTLSNDVEIILADCGPGISEDALQFVGEPFFRPEYARNRDSGGIGLGLAIVKSCVEHCGGSVSVTNVAAGGLQVVLRLRGCVAASPVENVAGHCQ